jgi:hypothetical protein
MPVEARDIHGFTLRQSVTITGFFMPDLIEPQSVIGVLNRAGVRFMLLGAYAIAGWTRQARATEDVDVLVAARSHKKAVAALLAAFPHLSSEDHEVVTRFRDPESGIVVIDVMKPNQPLYREALKHTHPVESDGQTYSIPSLELALAMKFSAMISLTRSDDKKHYDAGDFIRVVKSNPDIDLKKLHVLGQMVYNGGGAEVIEMVRCVRAGEKLLL